MGNYSEEPKERLIKELKENYVAVHMQQGVPLLDSDWNIMVDLLRHELYRGLDLITSSGVRGGSNDLKVIKPVQGNTGAGGAAGAGGAVAVAVGIADQMPQPELEQPLGLVYPKVDINITAGSALVSGKWIKLAGGTLSPLFKSGIAIDMLIYLEVWEEEVTDPVKIASIMNKELKSETCVRLERKAEVKFKEDVDLPTKPDDHDFLPLAILHYKADGTSWVEDKRPFLGYKNRVHAMWVHGNSGQRQYDVSEYDVSKNGVSEEKLTTRRLDRALIISNKKSVSLQEWIHFSIPTPVLFNDNCLTLKKVSIRFKTSDGAFINKISIHEGENSKDNWVKDNLALKFDAKYDVEEFIFDGKDQEKLSSTKWGIGISVRVEFPQKDSSINFSGVGADFGF